MNRLEYHLITGDSLRSTAGPTLESKTKEFWFNFWESVFRNNGSSTKPSFENLLRHDYVCVLSSDGTPIALSCSSLFDLSLRSTRSHPYFAGVFTDTYLSNLAQMKVRSATSIEYLSVNPAHRRRAVNIPLAQILIGLHVELFKSLGLDAIVAVSRSDVKVTQMAEKFGYRALVRGVQLHNTPCDLITCLRSEARPHPDPTVRALVERLWNEREDRTQPLTPGEKNENQLATGI
jgi:hypothetical protein